MFKKFKIEDVIFLAVLSAILLIASGLIVPIVMFTDVFALRQLLMSPIFALFSVIAIMKVKKIGTLTIIGIFTGTILLFINSIMFFNQVFGALITEILVYLIYKDYEKDQSKIFAAAVYVPMTIPVTLIGVRIIRGESILAQLGNVPLSIFLIIATILLGFVGAKLGFKIGNELKRAGKI